MADPWEMFQDFWNTDIPVLGITIGAFIIAVIVAILAYMILLRVALPQVRKGMTKSHIPPLLVELLARVIRILMVIVVLLIFLSLIGYDVSSIVLALSAVIGLILAFGMSDSMNNFFAGMWIAMLRPFRMNDVVQVAGKTGKVIAVGIMATELRSPDNVTIIIPNRNVWGEPVENYTRQPVRRVNTDVGIAYGSDVGAAIEVAMRLMKEDGRVLADPEPSVFLTELADSSVNLQVRPWVNTDDYWPVLNDLRRALHDELPKAGIEIPFPQVDVHMVPAGGAPAPASGMM